jgi:DNA-binding response OmpR family regulator
MAQHRVLAIDDERFFREVVGDVLRGAGIPYVTAATGADGLELAADPEVAAVILDLQLPDMHGLEVLRRLQERRPELRVVILSSTTDEEHVLEALKLGAFDYLAKPLHETELVHSVRRALDTYGHAQGWQSLRTRVDRLHGALAELWEEARGDGASADDLRALAVRAAAEVLGAARTSLLLLDENAAQLRVVAAVGNKVPTDEMDTVRVGEGVAGLAAARAEPLLVADVASDARFSSRHTPGVYTSQSFAVAPLTAGARTLGVLCATERRGGDAFDAEDLALLRILAGQVAHMLAAPASADGLELEADAEASIEIEIDDPTLVDPRAGRGPAREADVSARAASLAREVCEAVTAEVEPARILAAALKPISTALHAAPVSLYLRDAERGDLVREAECDAGARRSDRARLPTDRGLAGSVFASGQLVATGDPTGDPRFDPAIDSPADGVAGPLLCGALRFRGKPIGLFRAFLTRREDAEPELGELLAAALSAAARNVLLYRSLVQTIEEVAEARRTAGSES